MSGHKSILVLQMRHNFQRQLCKFLSVASSMSGMYCCNLTSL